MTSLVLKPMVTTKIPPCEEAPHTLPHLPIIFLRGRKIGIDEAVQGAVGGRFCAVRIRDLRRVAAPETKRENCRIYPSKMKDFMRYSWVLKG